MKLKIKRLRNEANLPKYALEEDAGMDLFSCEEKVLAPGERYLFKVGFAMEFDKGYVALIWDKSGLAAKKGIKTMGGVIEHTYRGELGIILVNLGSESVKFKSGDKIAQMLIQPITTANVEEVEELSDSVRGSGGFGSTGN